MIEILDKSLINWRTDNCITNIENFINHYNIKEIYLDVDGVLLHSCQAVCDMINEKHNTSYTGDEILSWNFKEICPNLTNEDVDSLFADIIFFTKVKFIDGAWDFLKRHENDIIIVTKGTEQNIIWKRAYFDKNNLWNLKMLGLGLNKSKNEIDMSRGLFIDDCTQNLEESNAKYKIQFLEYDDDKNEQREWIKGWNGLKMYNW